MNLNLVSFCSVVKNEENHLNNLIDSLLKICKYAPNAEFIFVDDYSRDNTFNILENYAKNDKRFIVIKNSSPGKVVGTNKALENCSKEYIKFIDGDDLLLGDYLSIPDSFQCLYHDYTILSDFDEKYVKTGDWLAVKPYLIRKHFRSIPKAMFIFNRKHIEKFFPIPENLPFEDLWINLAASEAREIIYFKNSLYVYRQHANQFYGSLSNFNSDKKIRMARRFQDYYDYLSKSKHPFSFKIPNKQIKHYAKALNSNNLFSYFYLLKSPKLFLKAIFYNFSGLIRLLWNRS